MPKTADRIFDVDYETGETGTKRLVLFRKSDLSATEKCPFCGVNHRHGIRDGHRIAHCAGSRVRLEILTTDGSVLRKEDGYIVKTGSRQR